MPFDTYCISMQNSLKNCICQKCGLYWPSNAAKKCYLVAHKGAKVDTTEDPDETSEKLILMVQNKQTE